MEEEETAQREGSRERWDNPLEFLLSCIGFSVGLGNVWRFPYLCYKHGGAAFMLVYLFLQLTIGKPLYFMELALGQYSGKSVVRAWDLCPALRGIGFAMVLVSLNIALYYNIILTYILFYMFGSFIPKMPWTICAEDWADCFESRETYHQPPVCEQPSPGQTIQVNCTCSGDKEIDVNYPKCFPELQHSTQLFFDQDVMVIARNIQQFGVPSWKLFMLMIVSWILVGLALIKGVKSTGKVVYFTATFPYVVLLIILVRASLLDGAAEGALKFIIPDFSCLLNSQLWIDAAGQMFFSLSLSMGGIIMYGSYNKFRHPIYRDAVIISTMDLLTSILAGFVVFTTLGYMAKQLKQNIGDVVKASFGLVFVLYPEILSTLALSNFWSCCFFFMLYTLGMDSQFALLETAMCYCIDDFQWCRQNATLFRVMMCSILCLLGVPLICPGGPYIIDALDAYGSGYVLPIIGLAEVITVAWIYGIKRFIADLTYMAGRKPLALAYWYFVLVIWCPLFFFALFIVTIALSEPPVYRDGTKFGPSMMTVCWLIFAYTLLPIPVWFALRCRAVKTRNGPFASMKELLKVVIEPSEKWGPADGLDCGLQARDVSVLAEIMQLKQKDPDDDKPTRVPSEAPIPATHAPEPKPVELEEINPNGDIATEVPLAESEPAIPPPEPEPVTPAAADSAPAEVTHSGSSTCCSTSTSLPATSEKGEP